MDNYVFNRYRSEANNWLKNGRQSLLKELVESSIVNCKQIEILEIGPGVGQNIPLLSRYGSVDAVEEHPQGLSAIQCIPELRKVYPMSVPFALNKNYDIICALDVLEHVEDDIGFINWISRHLKAEGIFIAIVPAYQWLFSNHDLALGHYRRYSSKQLSGKISSELEVLHAGYFNSILFPIPCIFRLVKNLFARKCTKTDIKKKDSSNLPYIVELIFGALLDFEVMLIKNNFRLPYGLSAYCVARRKH